MSRNTELENWAYAGMGAGCLTGIWNAIGPVGRAIVIILLAILIYFGVRDCRSQERTDQLASCVPSYFSGDFEGALVCFGTYIAEKDSKGEGYYWRGYSYLALDQFELAQKDFEYVIDKGEYKGLGYEAMGDLWLPLDPQKARSYYSKSIDEDINDGLKPEFASRIIGEADSFLSEDNYEEALNRIT